MSSVTELEAWGRRSKATGVRPVKLTADLDTSDARVGQFVTTPFGRSLVIGRKNDRYLLERENGFAAWETVASIELSEASASQPIGTFDVDRIIADYHAAMADKHRSPATAALIDLEAIRVGMEPKTLSEPERMWLLARLNNEARLRDTSPPSDMQQMVSAIIAKLQGEQPAAYDPRAAVRANVVPMSDDAKARISARLDPKAAAKRADTDYRGAVRQNLISIEDRIRRTGR